ncbi:MAG: hypothetical protein EH225_01455 [Calditrichaeota bacterium]|nr:MAG: hypothetical protein EH225_01455 [Calditrichota bacterium]
MSPPLLENHLAGVLILAALGSMTAPLSIGRIIIENRIKGRLSHFLQFVSGLDGFWGICIAGISIVFFRETFSPWFSSGWWWLILAVMVSVLIGLIFRYLIRLQFEAEEIFLLVLGLVIFTSGVGYYLKLSPIFMNMIVGMTIAQFHRESEKVLRVIQAAEKPTYLFLLVFAGAYWNYQFWEEILLIIAFILFRFLGKYAGGWIGARKINLDFDVPPDVGKAMLSFGGISLAIAFNFQLTLGGFMGDFIMSATILAILVFDEYTALSILNILRRQGEIS